MKRPVLTTVAAVWAVALGGLAIWAARTSAPTVRDQTTIDQAVPTVDAALGRIAATVDAGQVPVLSGYVRVDGDCRITAARSGQRYQRTLDVYVHEGGEAGLLDRVRAAAPAGWQAVVTHGAANPTLVADAGNYVAIRGAMLDPGRVRFIADTGCRPMPHPLTSTAPGDDSAERRAAQAVFDRLAVTPGAFTTTEVRCPAGGVVRTVEATAPGAAKSLVDALKADLTGVVVAGRDLYAARTDRSVGVVARTEDGHTVVDATAPCG